MRLRMHGFRNVVYVACLLAGVVALPLVADVQAQSARTSSDARREGEQLYLQIHEVLVHPRCLNCHPKGDSPKQGIVRQIHYPTVTRGPKDDGPAGLHCSACHTTKNFDPAGVPGAPNWHVAPRSMAWEDKTPGELCRALLDRRRNGNKSLAKNVKHLTEDELVAWGWAPGKDVNGNEREPVPIPKAEFNRIVLAWAKLGAPCPK